MKRDIIVLSILLPLLIAGAAFLAYKAYQYDQSDQSREAEKSRVMFARQARECALAFPLGRSKLHVVRPAINSPEHKHINNERGPQHLTGERPGSIVVLGALAKDGKQNAESYCEEKNFLHSPNVAETAG